MSGFSARSVENLKGVHPRLVQLVGEITRYFDCAILGGVRSADQQRKDVAAGLSHTMNSKHLVQPDGWGHALDVAPTPQQWDGSPASGLTKYDVQCIAFLFYAKGYAKAQGLELRIGADWNMNNLWTDNTFNDLDHIELANDAEPIPTRPPVIPRLSDLL